MAMTWQPATRVLRSTDHAYTIYAGPPIWRALVRYLHESVAFEGIMCELHGASTAEPICTLQ